MTNVKEIVDSQPVGGSLPPSWDPVDLTSIWDGLDEGTLERPAPTIGEVEERGGLFYSGRINGIFGRFGSAKSYVAAVTSIEQLNRGSAVWWIDFEDDAIGMVQRLMELGAQRDSVVRHFQYFNPDDALDHAEQAALTKALPAPSLIVIDSAGEWMSLQGVRSNYDEDVAAFNNRHLTPLARTGAAVLVIDHVPHDARDPLRAIGSQRKMAAISGAAYAVEMIRQMGKGRSGMTRLVCAKDRGGHHPRGAAVAELTIDATTTPYTVLVEGPATEGPLADEPPYVRRTHQVLLATPPPATVRQLGDSLAADGQGKPLKAVTIQKALRRLEELGLAAQIGGSQATGYEWASRAPDTHQEGEESP